LTQSRQRRQNGIDFVCFDFDSFGSGYSVKSRSVTDESLICLLHPLTQSGHQCFFRM
jgi:hypothetical protein